MTLQCDSEKLKQDGFAWARSQIYNDYNRILAVYQAQSCLENARGQSLLDMPCGDGTLTAMLASHFHRVVGVDASSNHLKLARTQLPSADFHEALIEDFYTSERFGTVTMINILEHVRDPVEVLKKGASLLESDGTLIIHVPNAFAINRRLAVLMGSLTECEELSPFDIQVVGHRRSYSMTTLCKDVEAANLQLVKAGGIFLKLLSTPQMDWFLKNGLWEEGGFGWGRVGGPMRDWKAEFCRACYEIGKERPEDCNIIFACVTR